MIRTSIGYWKLIQENPTPIFAEFFEAERKFFISRIAPDSKVLDIGCGDGRNMRTILNITGNVTGIDNDPEAVQETQKNLENFKTAQVLFADCLAMPFIDNTFDTAILMTTLVNFNRDKIKALKEASRVLKTNGKLIISVYSEDAIDERMKMYNIVGVPIQKIDGTKIILGTPEDTVVSEQFSKEDIERLAKEAGFTVSDYKKVGNLAYICELVKFV